MPDKHHLPDVAGLILAGGEGRRMGCVDKGLVDWQGRPLVAWVVEALSPVVSPLWISANRSREDYRQYSEHLVSDPAEFRWHGPLAGLLAGMRAAAEDDADAVLVSPCDTPYVTAHLFQRLLESYRRSPGTTVIARCGDRQHPLHGVYPVSLMSLLEQRLGQGERRVMAFVGEAGATSVLIQPEKLLQNINYLETGH